MDLDTSPRRGLALALVGAPLLWLAAEACSPELKGDTGDQLTVIAAHSDRWYAYTLLLLLGTVLFVPGVVGLARVARSGSPRLTVIGTALVGYGTVIAACDVMTQFTAWKAVGSGVDRTQMTQLFARVDDAAGVGLVFATGGISWLVGSVVLSVALARASSVPAWAGVAFGVGMVVQLFGFSASSIPMIAASAVIVLIAVAPIARALSGSVRPAVGEPAMSR